MLRYRPAGTQPAGLAGQLQLQRDDAARLARVASSTRSLPLVALEPAWLLCLLCATQINTLSTGRIAAAHSIAPLAETLAIPPKLSASPALWHASIPPRLGERHPPDMTSSINR